MRKLLLPFSVLLLLLPMASPTGAGLNDDVLGLIVFKADLLDPDSKLASWNEDDDTACKWSGVNCDPATNRVSGLSLDGFRLSGKLGRGLLQLQYLKKLSLSNNNFSGSLPSLLPRLQSLHTLDLSGNCLAGEIPDTFFQQCGSLRWISLAYNSFSGTIPPSIGTCSSLTSLNLSSNRLSGSLPSGLWSLYELRSLDLSNNLLDGGVPKGIGRLYNLRTVNLKGNWLSGQLPDDIGQCLLLKFIDLSANSLTGVLPDTMRKLSMCSYLNLSSNSISSEMPTWIGELKSLQSLDLSNNGFSGHLPDSLSELLSLEDLRLSKNFITGTLPESMGGCKSLKYLDLRSNLISGKLPSWVFQLGLETILVSGNGLGGGIWIPLVASKTIEVLDLSSNAFSGSIPVNIGNFSNLKFLNLSHNVFRGNIPASVGKLKYVEVVDLSSNLLNESVPMEIGGATSLEELRLERNRLSGNIPSEIGKCSSLAYLILSENNLTGSIPSALANLSSLEIVDFSINRLSGSIPKALGDLPHIVYFNISHNLISGDLPAGNFFNTIPASWISDNPGLCGAVVNRSCHSVLPKPIVLNPNSSTDPSSNPALSTQNAAHKKIILSISALIAIGAAALIALGVVTVTVLNIRVRAAFVSRPDASVVLSDDYASGSPGTDSNSGKLVMFSGEDPDFNEGTHRILNKDCELGRGGFGAVYKTILGDGRSVAIKKLTVSSLVKSQQDFEKEVNKLGKMRHPNLVNLEGYYWTPSLQLLIYEFISGGSLYKHLHESPTLSPLSWQERFDVLLGIARSLAHLHKHNIIHYNLKSTNVLIDGAGEPKVCDFGLAKLLPMLDRYVLSSKMQSALGYMAPEFACRSVKVTEKCDVYGFGILVLEIVTGRRPVEYMEEDVVLLYDLVRGALEEDRVEDCLDGRLQGCFPAEECIPVIKLGLVCTSQVPSNRPGMDEVVNMLELIRCPQDSQEDDLSSVS